MARARNIQWGESDPPMYFPNGQLAGLRSEVLKTSPPTGDAPASAGTSKKATPKPKAE